MKRLLILIFLLITTPCFAFTAAIRAVVSCGSAAATCTVEKDSCTGDENSAVNLANHATSYRKKASMFVADANATICAVSLKLQRVLNPTYSMTVEIWSNNDVGADNPAAYTDDLPSAKVGTGSASVAASTVNDAAYATISFTGLSVDITSGTIYWVVLIADGGGDATNYIKWGAEATDCAGDNEEMANYTASWTKEISTVAGEFQAYSE